jgi:hypothetical protein
MQLVTIETQVERILSLYSSLAIAKEHVELFKLHLLSRSDSWFVEVGEVGLVYLTNVLPKFVANLNFIFWDGKLGKDRRDCIRFAVTTAFDEFALTRMQALVPSANTPFLVTLKKIGFSLEGTMRRAWRDASGDQDLLILGMLKEERPVCQTLAALKTTTLELAI